MSTLEARSGTTLKYDPSKLPAGLVVAIEQRPRVVIVGRNSGSGGRAPRDFSFTDGSQATERLALQGVDFLGALPTRDEVDALQRAAEPHFVQAGNNETFTYTIVEIDRLDTHGVLFVFCNGSAVKTDESARQPWSEELARITLRVDPALIYGKRVDRLTRSMLGVGPFAAAAKKRGAYVGDERGFWDLSQFADQLTFFIDAGIGEQQALTMARTMPKAMITHTGESMASGFVQVGFPKHAPPGLMSFVPRTGNGEGRTRFGFDAPEFHPDPDTVASRMPQVFRPGPDGQPERVNQVENVKRVLSLLGRQGLTVEEIARSVEADGFSTDYLRARHNDPSFEWSMVPNRAGAGDKALGSIVSNLEFYETGILVLRYGGHRAEIRDCLPGGQPWADPEDFARHREWLRHVRREPGRRIYMTFSGLACLAGNVSATLGKAHVFGRNGPEYEAYVVQSFPHNHYHAGGFRIEHAELAAMITGALVKAQHEPVVVIGLDELSAIDDRMVSMKTALRRNETELEALAASMAAIEQQIQAVDIDGELLVRGPLATRLSESYAQFDARADVARQAAARLRSDLQSALAIASSAQREVAVTRLLEMASSLSDPFDTRLSPLWRRMIEDLRLIATPVDTFKPFSVTEFTAMARLALSDQDGNRVEIPLARTWQRWRDAYAHEFYESALTRMAGGIPASDIRGYSSGTSKLLRKRVGGGVFGSALLSCDSPSILKTVVRGLVLEPVESANEIAESLGWEDSWVERVLDSWRHRTWNTLVRPGPFPIRQLQILGVAARQEGVVRDQDLADWTPGILKHMTHLRGGPFWHTATAEDEIQLPKCEYCGGFDFALMRIIEPIGIVCRGCRRDRSRLLWPAEEFARYEWSAQ
jgi:hypothetical protein